MLTRTLAAVGLTLAMLAPIANAATPVSQQTSTHTAKAVKHHRSVSANTMHNKKNHHRVACKAGTKRVNGMCKAIVAKKY